MITRIFHVVETIAEDGKTLAYEGTLSTFDELGAQIGSEAVDQKLAASVFPHAKAAKEEKGNKK